jgi:hypothetical protein
VCHRLSLLSLLSALCSLLSLLRCRSQGIAAAGGNAEYDVPQCPPGTPVEKCTWEIWGVLTPGGDNLHLAAIHFHCHAPTCLEMAIYNNVTVRTVVHVLGTKQLLGFVLPLNVDLYRCLFVCLFALFCL